MKLQILITCILLSAWVDLEVTCAQAPTDHKLLVVLLDGFRWNYLDTRRHSPNDFPGFKRFRDEGVTTERLIPAFPSLSYVNYYSLMTGLYAETHGMVNNYMYDPKHNFTEFLIGENPEQYKSYWWDDGEPLWITAVKQNKRSYFWYWCGCEVEIRSHRPTFCQPYLSSPDPSRENFTAGLREAVNVLQNGTADIAGVFFEKVDSTGHQIGPNPSPTMKDLLDFIDVELNKVQDRLANDKFPGTEVKLAERVNFIVFSDHGMTEVHGGASNNISGVIHLYDYIKREEFNKIMGSNHATVLMIWPYEGQDQKVFERLANKIPHVTVYKKQDIPERYHIRAHYRIPPIYLVADLGYVILWNSTVLHDVGYHGYSNDELDMNGIFFAKGPDFKKNFTIKPLRNINLYQMMCHVTKLTPAPHNGTWSDICDVLTAGCTTPPPGSATMSSVNFATFILLCLCSFTLSSF